MKRFLTALLLIGFIAACGTQATEVPASPNVEPSAQTQGEPASPTVAPAATETDVPPSEAASPTVVIPTVPATEASAQTSSVSFANDVAPILQSRCWNCHGGDKTEEGLDLTTFAGVMAGSEDGPVVFAGDADNSPLAELIISQKMPKRGPKLTPPQVQVIVDWINQGALDN